MSNLLSTIIEDLRYTVARVDLSTIDDLVCEAA